jgi:DNA processing protein
MSSLQDSDAGFPPELRSIPSPVNQLYLRGRLPPAPRVALVGARRADAYGLSWARRLGAGLSKAGLVVVSGGAAGVDTAALEACLEAGGRPLAVLGTGVDLVYPAGNRALFDNIAERGALISEYPPGTPGNKSNFPKRNRIVSALSDGVVIVRAERGSGSLITARHAARQGRRVLAVPGPAGEALSAGCHDLLRKGACLVESVQDVLAALNLGVVKQTRLALDSAEPAGQDFDLNLLEPVERRIIDALGRDDCHVDALAQKTDLPSAAVSALLLQLELKGLVTQKPGMVYSRCP